MKIDGKRKIISAHLNELKLISYKFIQLLSLVKFFNIYKTLISIL